MTPRLRFTCLGWLSLGSLLLPACAEDSGQTGSPAQNPDQPYQSPGRKEPERPGGGTDNGGVGEGRPDAVPRPIPKPGSTALLGDTLVVAEHGELVLLDVSSPAQPRVLSHAELGTAAGSVRLEAGGSSLLRADSLAQLVVGVGLSEHATQSELPADVVRRQVQQVLEVDASDAGAPRIVSRRALPEGALDIAVRDGVYTALGAHPEGSSSRGGCVLGGTLELDNIGLGYTPPAVTSLWLERFDPGAPAGSRRELGAGYWVVSSDRSHALRVGLQPHETPLASFDVELVDLSSLETVFQTRLTPAELGAPLASEIGADYSDGVLVLAGGSRLLGFDVASGGALPAVSTPGPVTGVRFLDARQISLESSGAALAELDRSGAGASLRLVPLAAGTPLTGPLLPFGAGYIALDGLGGPNPLLRATSYARNDQGQLVLVDQLQTNWAFNTNFENWTPWNIDASGERLSYLQPNDSAGLMGVIQGNAGRLSASERVPTAQMPSAAFFHGDALLSFGYGVLQPLRVAAATSGPQLTALPAQTVVLEDVWFEVRHAGLIWARHRTDTGRSSLSVRPGEYDAPALVELPHAVDAIVPVDDSHVAVLGVSVSGMCDTWRDTTPDFAPECGPNAGNGVSIVAIDAGKARVVRSIALNSFLAGRPPAGIDQAIDWQGFLPIGSGKWALWGHMQQSCYSQASCDMLGVRAYKSYGTAGCSSGQSCPTGIQEFTSGSLNESWLFPLDLTDPEAPSLGDPVRPGPRLSAGGEIDLDLSPQLLGYDASDSRIWGYPVDEPIYGADGNSVTDDHGQSLHRWWLQLVEDRGSEPSFLSKVNVPGQTVLIAPGAIAGGDAQHTAFTIEPRYDEHGEQSVWLHRLRIDNGQARVEQSLELGPQVLDARAAGEQIAVLSGPEDYCAIDATYRLQVVDASQPTLRISTPLELPASSSYGWGLRPDPSLSGVIQLSGGPALGAGKLSVDPTSDPPRMLEYEY